MGDRGFAVNAAMEIAVEIAVEIAMASAMDLHGVPLLAAAFRGSPWNVRGSPWKVRGSPLSVRGYPRNTVGMAVKCRGGSWTLPRCSAKKTNNVHLSTFVTLDVVARRVGDGYHSPRDRHVPTSKADSSGTTAWVSSASVAVVVTVLCRVDDCFASQLRRVLMKIRPSQISV